jgi:hypothetical protein
MESGGVVRWREKTESECLSTLALEIVEFPPKWMVSV